MTDCGRFHKQLFAISSLSLRVRHSLSPSTTASDSDLPISLVIPDNSPGILNYNPPALPFTNNLHHPLPSSIINHSPVNMDPLLVASSSPFLQEQHEFQPPSSTSASFDISHSESPYLVDSFAFDQDYPQDGAHFPHTPSYNGSYQNSPYSVLSDLPTFGNEEADSLALFDDNPSGISITEEYDPSEYDAPNSTGLISFDESFMSTIDSANPHVSVSITPPAHDEGSPSPYDHASPASSNGADDDRRSHGSNASPYMHPHSPPLNDFTQNFESMHFESPSWSTSQLPGDRRSPPAQKAHSPPQLVIPDISSPSSTVHDEPPTINAPEGDGLLTGPQLHIVPATPISGGGAAGQNVQYMRQGSPHFPPCSLSRCFFLWQSARCSLSRRRVYGTSQ